MNKKLVGKLIILTIFLSVLVPTSFSESDEALWWNDEWDYREEIIIPIDTSLPQAAYQPIDISFDFNNSCWAVDKDHHSIRVIVQESGRFKELDSQIYDLKHTDESHISSCSLVFLIPDDASGYERYFVYYDDQEKSCPQYDDHVSLGESYYQYEPIPGLDFESWFYKIIEDDYLVYGVSKKGTALGDSLCHQITKLKPGSTKVLPKNGEQIASFNFVYWWKETENDKYVPKSTSDILVEKQTFVDGNLMVKFGIVSRSKDETLQTTVIYKYYYNPSEDKRIYTHVKHEVIGFPLETGVDIDVSYLTVNCGGVKSSTISDLNFGAIPPYIHFYGTEEKIISQDIPYPESKNWEEIIGKTDDYDLGSNAWLSVDNGEVGQAHAIVFESNNVLKSGTDERDGLELQLHEAHEISLPGLDGRLAHVYITRNSYEPGEDIDVFVPEDFVVEFNAEFFSTQNGGFETVEKEAAMYQSLISYQPSNANNITNGDEETNEYNIKVFGHLSPTLLAKMMGLRLALKNPYVTAELHYTGDVSSGTLSRFELTDELKVDWRNLSLFKKYEFSSLKPGIYVVKLWLENTLDDDGREFISVKVIDLQSDEEIHVFCKSEGKISVSTLDQNGLGIQNAQVYLLKDGAVIAESISDCDGNTLIGAPASFKENYDFQVKYKGFLINQESIKLTGLSAMFPLQKSFDFDVHDLIISLRDSYGQIPSFDADIYLTSEEMDEEIQLDPDTINKGDYSFLKLYPANYTLNIDYDCFEIKELINVPETSKIDVNLYTFFLTVKDNWSLTPDVNLDVYIVSEDFEKEVKIKGHPLSSNTYQFLNLYPGHYTLEVGYRKNVYKKSIMIPNGNEGKMTIILPVEFNLKINVFDSQAGPLANAEVILMRGKENETSGLTDENGYIDFSLPPGSYDCEIYCNGELVGERTIKILDEKSIKIVTNEKPLANYIVIAAALIMLSAAMIICRRKKDPLLFLKLLVIILALVAISSPWWSLYGNSIDPKVSTSTKMYIVPTEMVTITTAKDVLAGDLATLDERFQQPLSLLPLVITLSIGLIGLSLILTKYSRRKLSSIVFIFSNSLFIFSIVGFYYAMSEMSKIIVGGLYGSRGIEIPIPGKETYETLNCSWGPDIGFYLFLVSAIIISLLSMLQIKGFLQKKKR